MRAFRRLGFVALAISATVLGAAPAAAKNPPAPTAPSQPRTDGCQRSDFGIGFGQTPQWVYVYRSSAIRKAAGVTRVAHASVDDSQLQHDWYDFTANLVLDRGFRYLLGGERAKRTGNFAGHTEETRRVHYEWESGTLPFFAWPTDGDRTTLWGSWIWDCGHWTTGSETNTGGTVTGEHTELHPFNAIVVNRHAPYRPARNTSETDVFISNQGTRARAVERCALSHHPITGTAYPQYDSGFRPCTLKRSNRIQRLKKRYTFFVPAPPKPRGATRLKFKLVKRVHGGSGHERVRVKRNGLAVTVFPKGGSKPARYGKSFFVSWVGGHAKAPAALKLTLKSILIRHSDPDPIYGAKKSPWTLYLGVNGYWKLLNRWVPKLGAVSDGQRIAVNRTITIHVPRHAGVQLLVGGRECDEPSGTVLFGLHINLVHPCPANRTEVNPNVFRLLSNDSVGTILDTYRSARSALGRHVSTSAAFVRFPHTGRITLGHGKEGDGAFRLTYTIRRARK